MTQSPYVEQGTRLRVGVTVPVLGTVDSGQDLTDMALLAEEAGAQSLWVDDHILHVEHNEDLYPFTGDGRIGWDPRAGRIECLTACTHLAAVTSRCRVGTSVLVLPQRNTLELAAVALSIHRLSGNRFTLGVGAGWSASEMEALGYSARRRGARMDEMLDVLHTCWSGTPPPFHGNHVEVPENVVIGPASAGEGPPLLVGGMGPAAIRRAGRHGDGWLALGFVPEIDFEGFADAVMKVRDTAEAAGRPRSHAVLMAVLPQGHLDTVPELVQEAARAGFNELAIAPPWSIGSGHVSSLVAELCKGAAAT